MLDKDEKETLQQVEKISVLEYAMMEEVKLVLRNNDMEELESNEEMVSAVANELIDNNDDIWSLLHGRIEELVEEYIKGK